jgi:hypothetical protein
MCVQAQAVSRQLPCIQRRARRYYLSRRRHRNLTAWLRLRDGMTLEVPPESTNRTQHGQAIASAAPRQPKFYFIFLFFALAHTRQRHPPHPPLKPRLADLASIWRGHGTWVTTRQGRVFLILTLLHLVPYKPFAHHLETASLVACPLSFFLSTTRYICDNKIYLLCSQSTPKTSSAAHFSPHRSNRRSRPHPAQ